MTSPQVRKVLSDQIIAPVVANGWVVSAFRMYWKREQPYSTDMIWGQIAETRTMLDALVRQVPNLLFIISSINATNASFSDGTRMVKPGVAYWVVSREALDCCELSKHMGRNNVDATLKILLQPFQTSEKDVTNVLYSAVKDNMGGCVRRLVEDSQANRGMTTKEAIVKFYSASQNGPTDMLSVAINSLQQARFYSELYEI